MSRTPNLNKFDYEPAHVYTFLEVGADIITEGIANRYRDNPNVATWKAEGRDGRYFKAAEFRAVYEAFIEAPSKRTAKNIATVIYNHTVKKFRYELSPWEAKKESRFRGVEVYSGFRGFDVWDGTIEGLAETVTDKILHAASRGFIEAPSKFYGYYKKTATNVLNDAMKKIGVERDRREPLTLDVEDEDGNESRIDNPEIYEGLNAEDVQTWKYLALDDEGKENAQLRHAERVKQWEEEAKPRPLGLSKISPKDRERVKADAAQKEQMVIAAAQADFYADIDSEIEVKWGVEGKLDLYEWHVNDDGDEYDDYYSKYADFGGEE